MDLESYDKLIEQFNQLRRQIVTGAVPPENGIRELFALGYKIESKGLADSAESFYSRAIDLLEQVRNERKVVLTEQAFAELAISHGHRLFKMDKYVAAAQAFRRAAEALDEMRERGVSMAVVELLASAYHWLACCERKLNHLEDAAVSYQKSLGLIKSLLCFSRGRKRDFKLRIMLDGISIGYQKILNEIKNSGD